MIILTQATSFRSKEVVGLMPYGLRPPFFLFPALVAFDFASLLGGCVSGWSLRVSAPSSLIPGYISIGDDCIPDKHIPVQSQAVLRYVLSKRDPSFALTWPQIMWCKAPASSGMIHNAKPHSSKKKKKSINKSARLLSDLDVVHNRGPGMFQQFWSQTNLGNMVV
jgi:hypothetical protein